MAAQTGTQGDPVFEALRPVAEVMVPAVYMANLEIGHFSSLSGEAVTHLLRMRSERATDYRHAAEAIRADAALAPLLGPDGTGGAWIQTDVGFGWRIRETVEVPEELVRGAARYAATRSGATSTLERLLPELEDLLRRLRRLVAGESDEALVIMAYSGFALRDYQAAGTPWGRLRAPTIFEQQMYPLGGSQPTAILERTVPFHLKVGEPVEGEPMQTGGAQTQMVEDAPKLALAALLGIQKHNEPSWIWSTVLAPIGSLGGHFIGPGGRSREMPRVVELEVITDEELASIVEWTTMVAERHHPSINVATRRTLSAVSERGFSAEDALIDAVIAWENLFGQGQAAEMTFRVTAALAILLAEDPAERESLRSELATIYSLRSKLVHGAETRPEHNIGQKRDRAIEVALDALRLLFHDHPALLSDRSRGSTLILGVPPPAIIAG